ncbi:hypothetical protein [Janthinobacterium sp. AD80]|uniref:hypothetical protein n=1 Tax=Janthinobacterium sp. AD80 TaxID=1528773 RepID=UPI000CAD19E9|nr:hypothetical protein [Janthinobacterium sp. AD80]PMQ16932.1 hypothetical protein JaAD80_07975 [Janthinobacterium sp. AD80]
MNLIQILSFSTSAAIITFILNQLAIAYKERGSKREKVKYQGLRLCLALERFSIECADSINNQSNYDASQGTAGAPFNAMPLLTLPEVEWQLFPLHIVNKVLSFENELRDANGAISFAIDLDLANEGTNEPSAQAGLCGYRAAQLASKIRSEYNLGRPESPPHGWDHIAFLKKRHDEKIRQFLPFSDSPQ